MASKGTEVKKIGSNTKSILSPSNGTVEKTSPKSAALLKSPTAKTSPKMSSVKNGTDSSKFTNGTGIKKMETCSPPKVARSPSNKSMTPPNKCVKTVSENGISVKTNGIERKNSHGDCSNGVTVALKNDLIVDNGVVHSNGNCEAMLSLESKLKENHFVLESADAAEKLALAVDSPIVLPENVALGDFIDLSVPVVSNELALASGDKVCVKDKSETNATVLKQDSVDEKFEDAESDLPGMVPTLNCEVNSKGSPDSNTTTSTQCSTETIFVKDAAEEAAAQSEPATEEEVTKQSIRMKVWDHLEKNDLVVFPRPCQGRIPNFKGAPAAAEKLITLDVFKNSKTIKVNPDKPQEMVRFFTLEFGKRLLVPVPRLRDGLFQSVVPPSEASKYQLRQASQRFGMKRWSRPISTDENVSIDLIVLGSVAVDKKGRRLGKGEGFADLEFAVLMKMNAINENTVIVTTVHDDQIYDELPEHLFKGHDVPVNLIVTPTQVIEIKEPLPRPTKIMWDILSQRRILEVPLLQQLREEEVKEGNECTLKEVDSDVEEKPYIQRFTRRRRFNYSRATGDPLRDNKMYPPGPPRQYFYRVPRGPYMQSGPPPPNRSNNYGPPMMRNEPRRGYYHEPSYGPSPQPGRPQRMRQTRQRSMSRGNQQMRPQSAGRPQSQNRSRSMNRSRSVNRSLSMNRPNGPPSRSRRQSAIDYHHSNPPHMTKSVEVQTMNKSNKPSRTFIKRKRAPIEFSLRVKNIGMGVRVRDLKVALNERGIKPRDITWRGYKGFAFLHFVKTAGKENNPCLNVEEVIKTLKDLPLPPKDKKMLVIEPLRGKREGGEGAVTSEEDSVSVKEAATGDTLPSITTTLIA